MNILSSHLGLLLSIFVVLILMIGVFVYLFLEKLDELKQCKNRHQRLLSDFDNLDAYAKKVLNTDVVFHQTLRSSEEQEKALSALALFSGSLPSILDENVLFKHIDEALAQSLNFQSCYLAKLDDNHKPSPQVTINIHSFPIEALIQELFLQKHLVNQLQQQKSITAVDVSIEVKLLIQKHLNSDLFVLHPLFLQQKLFGIVLFFNPYTAFLSQSSITSVQLLSHLIAQSLENIRLFKEAFQATQILETKVTERTKELSQTLKAMEDVSKKKTEFISAVSHELRTPLTSIKGYASILMTGKIGEIPLPVKDRLAKINTHSDNLVKLINDLLDISRIESGRVEMTTSLLPMQPIIENVVDLLTPQLKEKNITFQQDIADNLPPAEIDRSQYERVFINLMSNAIKFTPPQGTITIQMHEDDKKEGLLLALSDTGIGMSKENVEKIFDEFFRADNDINLSVKGTGLGLALVKNIVEAHGGKIWVTSTLNVGTTFYFTLPFKHPIAPHNNQPIEDTV